MPYPCNLVPNRIALLLLVVIALTALMVGCERDAIQPVESESAGEILPMNAEPTDVGNCLSYPVVWAEGVTKALRTPPEGTPYQLEGEWWYWWGTSGTDPDIVPLSCPPDPDDPSRCDDGIHGQATGDLPGAGWVKAYLQKDPLNVWQAGSSDWSMAPVNVHWVDWGDNLESVDWYTRSQVRTEVVLFQDLDVPMLEYEMRHVSGWGIDEVHGAAAVGEPAIAMEGPGTRGTVYSPCARLTIQKLLVAREDLLEGDLVWAPEGGWEAAEPSSQGLINAPIFDMAVHEAQDGPGYYNAEINVKGRVIYGYTWNVRQLNEGAGDYRITFSFDGECGGVPLNTFFTEGVTQILVPLEEAAADAPETEGGGVAKLDCANNLTYIDVRIHERTGGGGKKPPRDDGDRGGSGGPR